VLLTPLSHYLFFSITSLVGSLADDNAMFYGPVNQMHARELAWPASRGKLLVKDQLRALRALTR
jgi:hypothetical protein